MWTCRRGPPRLKHRIRKGSQVRAVCGRLAGVFKTTDGGENWNAVSGLPAYVSAVVFDPRNSTNVYAATDSGLFRSTTTDELEPGKPRSNKSVSEQPGDRSSNPGLIYAGGPAGVFAISFVP